MFDESHLRALAEVTSFLFQRSSGIFWSALPVAVLIAFLSIYISQEGVSGAKIEGLLRRVVIAIAALVAFPEISHAIQGLEGYLIDSFGGDASVQQIFSQLSERAEKMKEEGSMNWLNVGQSVLNIIATLSFLVLALVRHFLDMLHLALWNLLHILGPIALIGCLFPSWIQIPKGIFTGMLELSLWKPVWVILARLLVAVGFGESPQDISQWFDTAVMNFAVAGLMASTPMIVHSFMSGAMGAIGGSMVQTMASGVGGFLAAQPMRMIQQGAGWATKTIPQSARSTLRGMTNTIKSEMGQNNKK